MFRNFLAVFSLVALIFLLIPVHVSPALSVSTDKPEYARGETVTITVQGTAGTGVGVQVVNPSGGTVFVKELTIGSGGSVSTSFKLSSSAQVGTYTVYVSGGGETATTTFKVKYKSSVTISLSTDFILIGESVVISGSIYTTDVPHTATVVIEYKSSSSLSWSILATVTAVDGDYSYTWTPSTAGTYNLRARWDGDDTHFGATSSVVTLTVSSKKRSTLTIHVSPEIVNLGGSVQVYGQLTGSSPIAGATITITYKAPTGATTTHTVTTNSSGHYVDTFTPNKAGLWTVTASWSGNDQYLESSASTTFRVRYVLSITLNAAPRIIKVGWSVLLVCNLSSPIEGAKVTIWISGDGSTWDKLVTVTTGVTGYAGHIWVGEKVGVFYFKAVLEATTDYASAESNVVEVEVKEEIPSVEELLKDLEDLKEQLNNVKKALDEAKKKLGETEDELNKAKKTIEDLEKMVSKYEQQIKSLQDQLKQKDSEMSRLEGELASARGASMMYLIIGLIMGLVIGLGVGYFVFKRKS